MRTQEHEKHSNSVGIHMQNKGLKNTGKIEKASLWMKHRKLVGIGMHNSSYIRLIVAQNNILDES